MVGGVGLAYASSPTNLYDSGYIISRAEQLYDFICCSEETSTELLGDDENPHYPGDNDSPYLDIETLPIVPDNENDEDYVGDDNEEYYNEYDDYYNEYEELEALNLDLIEQFVVRLYEYILRRNYDVSGLYFWSNELREGRRTGASVAHSFFFSPEFRNRNYSNEEFVELLYRALMGRDSDPGGRAFWLGRLNAGLPRVDVFASFIRSWEFGQFCELAGIERGEFNSPPGGMARVFVTRMYRTALQREPDIGGLDHWTNQFVYGNATGAAVAYSFIFSREMYNRNLTDRQFVEILYNALMGRNSDQGGMEFWLNRLQGDFTRHCIFVSFVSSDEFGRICSEHGITRGTPPPSPHAPPPPNTMRGDTIVARIWNLMVAQQFSGISDRPEHIAGIIGNLRSEAGPNLCPFQQEIGGNRAGLGLMQWSHGRRTHLESFMWRNGVSQADFTREMNRHLNSICSGTCMHPPELLNRVLQLQVQFMFYELTYTFERQYMNFIDFPASTTGIAGARAYAELFCAIALRPSPGRAGGLDDIQDVGVIEARRASAFGGVGNLDRISFSGLAARRNNAEQIFRQFQADHR